MHLVDSDSTLPNPPPRTFDPKKIWGNERRNRKNIFMPTRRHLAHIFLLDVLVVILRGCQIPLCTNLARDAVTLEHCLVDIHVLEQKDMAWTPEFSKSLEPGSPAPHCARLSVTRGDSDPMNLLRPHEWTRSMEEPWDRNLFPVDQD